jgi:tetratricopeptide (TPR) repeat protein/tRNA A-37 threonylcarbamoyl transferase component Bud32
MSSPDAEGTQRGSSQGEPARYRNRLFVGLALRNNLIDAAAVRAALTACESNPLLSAGQALVAAGAISGEDRQAIEQIVESIVRRHGFDAQATLSALGLDGEPAETVSLAAHDAESVDATAAPAEPPGIASPRHSSRGALGANFGDYELLERVAQGGMGVVYKARQIKLNRIVALKMILAGQLASEDQVRRFYVEAEAAANLDHPGIVPIYEVGQHQGQHFYSMGFVEGQSLAGRLAAGPLPPREAAELILKTALAVAYAHEHGVIHRDLKPSNILLDAQGQPRVTDFGLAKRVEADSELTASGAVIGTPSYMPPEQAAGRIDQVGPLADIYSLGATLYCLLTGRPPFQAAHAVETLKQVIEHEPVSPRQLNGAVGRDLETICLKCLQKEPARRYCTAAQLAEDLARYLDGRPITARPISLTARFVRWCRRNRRIAILSGALLLALLGGLVGTTLGLVRAEQRRLQVETERDKKDTALQAETKAREAETVARTLAMDALRKLTDRVVEQQLARRTILTEEDRRFLRDIQRQYEEFAKLPGEDAEQRAIRAEGHRRVAVMRHRLGEEREAEASYRQAVLLYQQLTAEFPSRPELRWELAASHNNLGNLLSDTGRLKEAEAAYAYAVAIFERLATEFPTRSEFRQELARSHNNLGVLLRATGRLKEAEAACTDAVAIFKQLAADFPTRSEFRRELALSHNNLGSLLRATGRLQDAEAAYADALAIQKQLAADFPTDSEFRQGLVLSHNNLGNLLYSTGRPKEAELAHADALAIQKQLAADFPNRPEFRQDLARSHNNLGLLLRATGRPKEAELAHADALAIQKQLAADFPNRPEFRQDLGGSHKALGNLLSATRRLKEAESAHADALAIFKQLAADFPTRPEFRSDLAQCYINLGLLLRATGRRKQAELAHADALAIQKQLAADFPKVPHYRNELAGNLVNLALLDYSRRDFAQARRWLEEAQPHHQAALQANPRHPDYRQFYWNNLMVLTQSCAGQGDQAAAVEAATRVHDLGWDPPGNAYNAACALAMCVPIVETDDKASKEERDRQMQFYAEQAMTMLRDAVAKGFKDAAHMKKDTDLDPLRSRADFQKLLAELEAKAKAEG